MGGGQGHGEVLGHGFRVMAGQVQAALEGNPVINEHKLDGTSWE